MKRVANHRLMRYIDYFFAPVFVLIMLVGLCGYLHVWNRLPSTIRFEREKSGEAKVELPLYGRFYEDALQVSSSAGQISVNLFGVIPLKDIDVEEISEKRLKPVGMPVGIYVKTEGVLVIATGEFENDDGKLCSPCKYVLQPGDYILEINDEKVNNKKELMEKIGYSEGQDLILKIRRNGEEVYVMSRPQADRSGEYKLGIWVRDNAQGVGTMTYIDEDGHFGALGHGINDVDTGELMSLKNGTLYHTEIIGITRGKGGAPGELTGFIEYDDRNRLGSITENTSRGIFGMCDTSDFAEDEETDYLPIGLKQEIHKGEAEIICSFGEESRHYQVEIVDINLSKDHINRGIVLRITDEKLLRNTGGIIQGMSGSPIVQDGKLIGAVTHVFVNDPTRGYGIFIENMLED